MTVASAVLTPELKSQIKQRASSFEPSAIVGLLRYYGFDLNHIILEGHHGMETQASLVRDVDFESDGTVRITLHMGLAGPNTPLPMYIFEMVDKGLIDARHFRELIGFFDSVLLKEWIQALKPDDYLFSSNRQAWLKALASFSSQSAIHWLFQAVVPELEIRVSRAPQPVRQVAKPAVIGRSKIGLEMIFGHFFNMMMNLTTIYYIAEAERTHAGEEWSAVILSRFERYILPLMRGLESTIELWLIIREPKQWLELNAGGLQLGFETFKGNEDKQKRILIFSGQH